MIITVLTKSTNPHTLCGAIEEDGVRNIMCDDNNPEINKFNFWINDASFYNDETCVQTTFCINNNAEYEAFKRFTHHLTKGDVDYVVVKQK